MKPITLVSIFCIMALTSGSYEKHSSLSKETATRNHVKGYIIKPWLTLGTKAAAILSSVFRSSGRSADQGRSLSGRQLPKSYLGVAFPKTDFSPGTYEAVPASFLSHLLVCSPRPRIK